MQEVDHQLVFGRQERIILSRCWPTFSQFCQVCQHYAYIGQPEKNNTAIILSDFWDYILLSSVLLEGIIHVQIRAI